MKISELSLIKPLTFTIRLERNEFKEDQYLLGIRDCRFHLLNENIIHLEFNGNTCEVNRNQTIFYNKLESVLTSGIPTLATIIKHTKISELESDLLINLYEFSPYQIYFDKMEIGVDDECFSEIEKYTKIKTNKQSKIKWLEDIFILFSADTYKTYLLLNPFNKEGQKGFCIYGNDLIADVKMNQNGVYYFHKIRRNKNKGNYTSICLTCCEIKITDIGTAGESSALTRTQLEKIYTSSTSFIKLWEEYNKLENILVESRREEIGLIKCNKIEKMSYETRRLRVSLASAEDKSKIKELFQRQECVEISDDTSGVTNETKSYDNDASTLKGSIISVGDSIIIEYEETNNAIPKQGYLSLSMRGDKTRIDRRNAALELIKEGRSKITYLGLLLEKEQPPIVRKNRPLRESIAKAVKDVFSNKKPNDYQLSAIESALASPDISVIIGPPGSGKTKVIKAIAKAMDYELRKESNEISKGRILFTSESHDAVNNMISESYVLGLPPIKVDTDVDRDLSEQMISFQEALIKNISSLKEYTEKSNIRELINKVFIIQLDLEKDNAPLHSISESIGLLLRDHSNYIPVEIVIKIKTLLTEITSSDKTKNTLIQDMFTQIINKAMSSEEIENILLKILVRLRKQDDLKDLTYRVENINKEYVSSRDIDLLKTSITDVLGSSDINVTDLKNNESIRNLSNILTELRELLEKDERYTRNNISSILHEYVDELYNNPLGLKSAILEYTQVFGTTAQGSAKKNVGLLKDENEEYDLVVVDEAAKVNPLDMLIPLTKAKKIVLVGDDNQLPHMLDPDIEKQLRVSDVEVQEAYKKSLFRTIKESMLLRQSTDRVTRVVQLNTQYRMHRILGNLISETFYNGDLKTGIEDELVEHHIPNYDSKSAVWIDVPIQMGPEFGRKSKCRMAEATVIVDSLKAILSTEPNYTIGVITFYAQQKELIQDLLEKEEIIEKKGGTYNLNKRYALDGYSHNRLKIGTVDAFQGQEFDVVLLSLTRSNDVVINTSDANTFIKKYGFLLSHNRQNVSLSRAKRLCVLVGDSMMFSDDMISTKLKGFYNYLKLCKSNLGKVINA